MLSGVGPGDHLKEKGIPVRVDNQHVGQNLHDHLGRQYLITKRGQKLTQTIIAASIAGTMNEPVCDIEGSGVELLSFYQSEWAKKNTPHDGPDMEFVIVNGPVQNGLSTGGNY